MDYCVGSVAALISGNVTPNRPKLIKRALTPTKHQPSPNVTPKSEFVDDRSIFLSPSVQKKKAIVKKSPKRIFENPNLDATNDGEGVTLLSPKADKVKKHLKDDLEADEKASTSPKTPKKAKNKLDKSLESGTSKKNLIINENNDAGKIPDINIQSANESTPKKKKKQKISISLPVEEEKENVTESPKKSNKKRKSQNSTEDSGQSTELVAMQEENEGTPKKKSKNKKTELQEPKNISEEKNIETNDTTSKDQQQCKKKRKKNKKNKNKQNITSTVTTDNQNPVSEPTVAESPPKKKHKKNIVNPNPITDKDSDSEHESDDEIQSENEKVNNEILNTKPTDSSDDEEEKKEVKKPQKQEKKERKPENEGDEIKRTLFVGNVPFSKRCKKEVKKIFNKYGQIETVRIRTVPVKDARVTPKLAVIKNELHPERTTVNVYVKFRDASSVDKALAENNTVLNDHHIRVTRSDTTGNEHDPNKAIFVGNLPFAIEDDVLRAKFEKCGEIESVRVIRDSKTNAGKGFGYVNFASKDSVELALAMSEEDLTIKNRIIRVKRSTATNKKQGNQEKFPGNQGKFQKNQGKFQGNQGKFQRNEGKFQGNQGRFQGNQGKFQGNQGRNDDSTSDQGKFGRSQGNRMRSQGNQGYVDRTQGQDGAHRRILNKRQSEEGMGGPPNKRPNIDQPAKEKKPRKEFVGMTSEKKKKQKTNKGHNKKKALSEILTKYNEK